MNLNGKSLRKNLVHWGISLFLTLVLLEIGSLALVETNLVPARVPSYRWPEPPRPFIADVNPHFGTWHVPNSRARHTKSCFDVVYESNSYGAVDRERERRSDLPRTVVIGDSFVEGFGVNREDRFTDQLEAETGIPHLNFSTSGDFGPTQYYLCYQHLASEFDHDTVIVAILPDNDFRNDNPNPDRYRPYWDGSYPDFTLRYSADSLEDSTWSVKNVELESSMKPFFRNFSYAFNCGEWVEAYLDYRSRIPEIEREHLSTWSGYYDCTDRKLLRLRFSLEKLRESAEGKNLVVFSIPRLKELMRFDPAEGTPFGKALQEMADEIGFTYIDLLPVTHDRFEGKWNDIFLSCDDHWSPYGHTVTAGILKEELYPEER